MERYTLQERIEIIKIHYKLGKFWQRWFVKHFCVVVKHLLVPLDLDIPQTSLHRIWHKDLGFKAYKFQLTQELKPADHQQRRIFADWVVEMLENDPEFHRKMSDEAHFYHGGFVNKQNCRIWSSKNPKIIVEKPVYPQRVIVWCSLWYDPAESLDLTFSKMRLEQQLR